MTAFANNKRYLWDFQVHSNSEFEILGGPPTPNTLAFSVSKFQRQRQRLHISQAIFGFLQDACQYYVHAAVQSMAKTNLQS